MPKKLNLPTSTPPAAHVPVTVTHPAPIAHTVTHVVSSAPPPVYQTPYYEEPVVEVVEAIVAAVIIEEIIEEIIDDGGYNDPYDY